MKYHLFTILERNGEYENHTEYLLATEGNIDVDQEGLRLAREHRSSRIDQWDDLEGGYWADHMLIFFDNHKEIPPEHGEVLAEYICTEFV